MNSQLVNAFTVALLHFVWQGAILTALAAVGLRLMGAQSAKARYALACGLLFAMPLVVAITTVVELRSADATRLQTFVREASERPVGLSVAPPMRGQIASPAAGPTPAPPRSLSQVLASWVLPLWLLGVAVLCGFRAASWIAAQRLRRRAVCAAAPEWQQKLNRLVRQLRISRPVAMLESSLTDTPLTMGVLRPVVLLPIGLLAGLPVEQIELILLHELAHIRRHDYLVNLLQTAVESLLFYHPGVWWLSRRIRMEREYCCDDIVVAATDDVAGYARTLTELEQRRAVFNDAILAATGGNLMFRIQRLLGRPVGPKGTMSGPLAIVLLLASCAALFGWQNKSFTPVPQNSVAQVQAGSPRSGQSGNPASSDQAKGKIGQQLKPNPFFHAIHEHLWHAVLWFHQLIGLAPPKHTAAIPAEVLKDPQGFAADFRAGPEGRQLEQRNTAKLMTMQQAELERTREALARELGASIDEAESAALTRDERWNAQRLRREQADLERQLREITAQASKTSVQGQIAQIQQLRAQVERQLAAQQAAPMPKMAGQELQGRLEQLRAQVEAAQAEMRFAQAQFRPPPTATTPESDLERQIAALERTRAKLEAQIKLRLETPYDRWLNEEVRWIVTDSERAGFKQLQTDEQRQMFIEQFWLRRDATPGTTDNEFREEHYRRLAWANEHFAAGTAAGWSTDRGMMYIRFGPPDKITMLGTKVVEPDGSTLPMELWQYKFIEGMGTDISIAFDHSAVTGEPGLDGQTLYDRLFRSRQSQ